MAHKLTTTTFRELAIPYLCKRLSVELTKVEINYFFETLIKSNKIYEVTNNYLNGVTIIRPKESSCGDVFGVKLFMTDEFFIAKKVVRHDFDGIDDDEKEKILNDELKHILEESAKIKFYKIIIDQTEVFVECEKFKLDEKNELVYKYESSENEFTAFILPKSAEEVTLTHKKGIVGGVWWSLFVVSDERDNLFTIGRNYYDLGYERMIHLDEILEPIDDNQSLISFKDEKYFKITHLRSLKPLKKL